MMNLGFMCINPKVNMVFQDEPNLAKINRVRSSSKQMIACFFGKTGHFTTEL